MAKRNSTIAKTNKQKLHRQQNKKKQQQRHKINKHQQQQQKNKNKKKKKNVNKHQQKVAASIPKNNLATTTDIIINNNTTINPTTTTNTIAVDLTTPSNNNPTSPSFSTSFLPPPLPTPTTSSTFSSAIDNSTSYSLDATPNTVQNEDGSASIVYTENKGVSAAAYAAANNSIGNNNNNHSAKVAHIAGPIVGIFAGIAFIAAAMFLIVRNRRKRINSLTTNQHDNNYNDKNGFQDIPLNEDDEAIAGMPPPPALIKRPQKEKRQSLAEKKKSIISTATTETFVGSNTSRSNSLSDLNNKHTSWNQYEKKNKRDSSTLVNTRHISSYMQNVAERQHLQHEKPNVMDCFGHIETYKAQLADMDAVESDFNIASLENLDVIVEDTNINQQVNGGVDHVETVVINSKDNVVNEQEMKQSTISKRLTTCSTMDDIDLFEDALDTLDVYIATSPPPTTPSNQQQQAFPLTFDEAYLFPHTQQ